MPIAKVERPKGAGDDGKRGSLIEDVDGERGGGGSLMRGGEFFLSVVL